MDIYYGTSTERLQELGSLPSSIRRRCRSFVGRYAPEVVRFFFLPAVIAFPQVTLSELRTHLSHHFLPITLLHLASILVASGDYTWINVRNYRKFFFSWFY